MRSAFRTLGFALVAVAGCTHAGQLPVQVDSSGNTCSAASLKTCEALISNALRDGTDTDAWTGPYLLARETARGPSDPWVVASNQLAAIDLRRPPTFIAIASRVVAARLRS